jgi:hypothetical protein
MNTRVADFSRPSGAAEIDRLRPTMSNFRQRPVAGAGSMAKLGDLKRNPIDIVINDADGEYFVCVERMARGSVRLSCGCSMSGLEGWCRHRIDLLSARYGHARWPDRGARRAFELIVTGTALIEAGRAADRALRTFDQCLFAFDSLRPPKLPGRGLNRFTNLATDLAASAGELEDALNRLRSVLGRG